MEKNNLAKVDTVHIIHRSKLSSQLHTFRAVNFPSQEIGTKLSNVIWRSGTEESSVRRHHSRGIQ
jgi:hypothetical protein